MQAARFARALALTLAENSRRRDPPLPPTTTAPKGRSAALFHFPRPGRRTTFVQGVCDARPRPAVFSIGCGFRICAIQSNLDLQSGSGERGGFGLSSWNEVPL